MKERIREIANELLGPPRARARAGRRCSSPRSLPAVRRPLPVGGDGRPGTRDRGRAARPRGGQADGPAGLRRRRLRQDRGRASRRVRRGDDGQQVARGRPTTLLARQHYQNFVERFQGFPLSVGRLSRLVPAAEARRPRKGSPTARSTSSSAPTRFSPRASKFKRLGLVIVDEEQHFGVTHKERLKALRADVHVLTLTATPIPRTLQMAMSGLRELSIIQTPPVDRLAVRTYVMPWDGVVHPRSAAA